MSFCSRVVFWRSRPTFRRIRSQHSEHRALHGLIPGQKWRPSGRRRLTSAPSSRLRPIWDDFDQQIADVCQMAPDVGQIWEIPPNLARYKPAQGRQRSARFRPSLALCWPDLGQFRQTEHARECSMAAERTNMFVERLLTSSAHTRVSKTNHGCCCCSAGCLCRANRCSAWWLGGTHGSLWSGELCHLCVIWLCSLISCLLIVFIQAGESRRASIGAL